MKHDQPSTAFHLSEAEISAALLWLDAAERETVRQCAETAKANGHNDLIEDDEAWAIAGPLLERGLQRRAVGARLLKYKRTYW